MPKDDLAQIRRLRDDLRALKAHYPALTRLAAKRRLEDSPLYSGGDPYARTR